MQSLSDTYSWVGMLTGCCPRRPGSYHRRVVLGTRPGGRDGQLSGLGNRHCAHTVEPMTTEQICRHCSKTTRMFRCRHCSGYGAVDGTYCRACKGNGEVCQHCEKPN